MHPDGIKSSTNLLLAENETTLALDPALRQIEKGPKGKADRLLSIEPFGNLYRGATIEARLLDPKETVPKLEIFFNGGFMYTKSPGFESLEIGK